MQSKIKSMDITTHTPEQLEILKKALPHGSIKNIATKAGVSRQAVSDVLKGEYYNESVITEALNIIEREKEKQERLSARIKEALGSKA